MMYYDMRAAPYQRRVVVPNRPRGQRPPGPIARPAPPVAPPPAVVNTMYMTTGLHPSPHAATMYPPAPYMTVQTAAGPAVVPVTMAPVLTRPLAAAPPAPAPVPPAVAPGRGRPPPRRQLGGPLPAGLPPGNYRRVIARRRR